MLRLAMTLQDVVSEVVNQKAENEKVIEQVHTLTSSGYTSEKPHQSNGFPAIGQHHKWSGNKAAVLCQLDGMHVQVGADGTETVACQASVSTCADVCSIVDQCIDRVQKALDRAKGMSKHNFADFTRMPIFHEAS